MTNRAVRLAALTGIVGACVALTGCHVPNKGETHRWHSNYSHAMSVPPIEFHYHHGVLAGSYPGNNETVRINFDDVCAQLGHVCLCGAGGFRIAREATAALHRDEPLERGEFLLISGRDHSVSDVIAFVLGCVRRDNSDKSQYFIDDSIEAPRREYHYYIGHSQAKEAVHIVYRKHLLIGHDAMDELWQIELGFDRNPDSVSTADMNRYRRTMRKMVYDVLFDRVPGLISVEPIEYEAFEKRVSSFKCNKRQ